MTDQSESQESHTCAVPRGSVFRWTAAILLCAASGSAGAAVIYQTTLDTDPGWTCDTGWAFGAPAGGGGGEWGNPDPAAGATGTNVYGVNLDGDYSFTAGWRYLTAGPFDCSSHVNVWLQLKRWLNNGAAPEARATIEVSNGTGWTTVFDSAGYGEIADNAWALCQYDVSAVADKQATVYVRWGYNVWEGASPYSGWNIDDIALTGDYAGPPPVVFFRANLDANPGWTSDTGWAFGTPTGGGGAGGQYGNPDPTSGHTGSNVYGYNLDGDYENNLGTTQYLRTTPAINCSDYANVHLTFWRWLGVFINDYASVEVSNNGTTWTTVSPTLVASDDAWTRVDYDISAVANRQATVFIRWGMGPTDDTWQFCGWNIDDVNLNGTYVGSSVETYRFERMWPTLPQPWYFYEPKGIAVDSSGNVYVADTQNNRVQKFDANGRFITKWGALGSGEGQFTGPQGVAVDGSGNVYVADTGNHRVQKFTATGEFLGTLGSYGAGNGQFSGPRGLAVDASGNVYVADTGNHRVQKFDANGAFIAEWGSFGTATGQFSAPEGIAVDTSGNVYVADTGNNRIQRLHWNSDTEQYDDFWIVAWFGLDDPVGVAVDGAGNIFIADTHNNRIQKLTASRTFVTQWGSAGSGDGQFYSPSGVAIEPVSGSVYVADLGNSRVQKFRWNGVSYGFTAKWSGYGSGNGQFHYPEGVAVDSAGNVYVADTWNDRIQKFTASGGYLTQWGVTGAGNGQFQGPKGVAVDDSGNVYVTDKHRIQKFTASGGYLTQWGIEGSSDGRFLWPQGVAVDTSGNVYVADTSNHRIQKFTASGGYLTKWGGGPGSGNNQLNFPKGVAVDASGYVYVADSTNNRIMKLVWNPSGGQYEYLEKWGGLGSAIGEFREPKGIAVDASSNVYVADTDNHRIQKFDSSGVYLAQWGGLGAVPGRLVTPFGVAVNAEGVYVVERSNHRVQKFVPATLEFYDKAVIVAGRKAADDILWPATQKCTVDAYRALNFRALDKYQICYLSHNFALDIDDNGLADDVDDPQPSAPPQLTVEDVQQALTSWAPAHLNGLPTRDVVVYLADHGSPDHFYVGENVFLEAPQLDGWLDSLESGITGTVTVVIDTCYSGSFVTALAATGRKVITSAQSNEVAYFLGTGATSFSGFFWQRLLYGYDLGDCFAYAKTGVNLGGLPEHPQVDANGNGLANEVMDFGNISVARFGTDIQYTTAFPTITSVSDPQRITGTTTALLTANGVTDSDGSIARVYAVIQPPGFETTAWDNPILGLPEVTLNLVSGTNYAIEYDGFTKSGRYKVNFYALDNFLYLSEVKRTTVDVGATQHRRAILVAGGSPYHEQWPAYEQSYARAYEALHKQLYNLNDLGEETNDEIYILAHTRVVPSTVMHVYVPTIDGLEYALQTWTGTDTKDLTLYLVGPGYGDMFQLNDDQDLTASALNDLLTDLQNPSNPNRITGMITVVYDACSAGSFVDDLGAPGRIVVTSTAAGKSARFLEEEDGLVSFSRYFWDRVMKGDTVERAYLHAKENMADSDQEPGLDDNGDGLLSQPSDFSVARYYRIGNGIVLGADEPVITTATADEEIPGDATSVKLRADGVYSPGRTITSVWATIAPPGYTGGEECFSLLPRVDLTGSGTGPYTEPLPDNPYSRFTKLGTYVVKFFCMDNKGNISKPKTCLVTQNADLGDETAPAVSSFSPANEATGVAQYPVIQFTVTDAGSGADINSISLTVNGIDVSRELFILGTPGSYNVRYNPRTGFEKGSAVYVTVTVADLDGNKTEPLRCRFTITDGTDGNADGVPDDWYNFYFPEPPQSRVWDPATQPDLDTDGDGYSNFEELERGTDPRVPDALPTGPDDYEDDDIQSRASWATVNGRKQAHNFHDLGDTDWVEFYANADTILNLSTFDLGPKADTVMELYSETGYLQTDDNLSELASKIEGWNVPASGYYFVKIRNAGSFQNAYGAETYYSFKVVWPSAGWELKADAGSDLQPGQVGHEVPFSGTLSTSSASGDYKGLKSFTWTIRDPAGSSVLDMIYVDETWDGKLRHIGMYFVPTVEGVYIVTLVVEDGSGLKAVARMAVDVGDSRTVWVDLDPPTPMTYDPQLADGSAGKPFLDVWRARDRVDPGGIISILTGDTSEKVRLWSACRVQAVGAGLVRIGVPAKAKSALDSEGAQLQPPRAAAEDGPCYDDIGATIALGGAGSTRTQNAQDTAVHYDRSTYEPVLPFTRTADGLQAAQADSALAIRLRSEADIDPSSIWGTVGEASRFVPGTRRDASSTIGEDAAGWQPVDEGGMRDIWVIFQPQETWYLEDIIPLTAGATNVTGEPVESMTYQFRIESEAERECRLSEPVPALPQPAYGQDFDASELDTGAESNDQAQVSPADEDAVTMPLPEGVDTPVIIGPEQVYDTPQRVWLPIPEGVNPGEVRLYYYHATGDTPGWYPAENVEGWLVPDSYLHLRLDGTTYLGFLVRHAGIVQLGIPERQEE